LWARMSTKLTQTQLCWVIAAEPKSAKSMSKSPTAERSNLGQVTYYNQILDKKGTKKILSWFLDQYGPTRTSQFLEELKSVGFHFATLAGISLGFDDLKIPQKKIPLLQIAEQQIQACEQRFQQGKLTAVERYQKVITLWTTASENLKDEVIHSFQSTDLFNPLYMMAFSGARGNISQVRQLVGMRGLMSDSGGGIIDFPIRRNFREGLTVTEYAISCYGARKGLIDTALRTADSGYLTRRLVDVAHGIMIGRIECGTDEGFEIAPLRVSKAETGFGKSGVLLSLEKRILGRVLAQDVCLSETELAKKNQEITPVLAHMICAKRSADPALLGMAQHSLLIRSPLTCKHFQNFREDICQLCYGWSLSQGRLVSLGEAVGILAAQSIGEPGTQLTLSLIHI
jgi:DNA-directed RNA polymerase subunit beta'